MVRWILVALLIAATAHPAPCSSLPRILFDHPTDGFIFHSGGQDLVANLVFAIRGRLGSDIARPLSKDRIYSEWEGYEVTLSISDALAGSWRAVDIVNSIGEVKLEATVLDIAQGSYTATCRLVQGDALDDISHSVSFSVGHVPDGPRGDEHFCPACKMADLCQDESADQCSGRGTCRNGACMCFADFAGDQCEHSITHDVSYLPTLDPRDSPSACQKSLLWEHGARNLQSTMASMGSARACRDREPLSGEMVEGLLPFAPSMHGLGFNLHYVTHMMGWGLATSRMPVLVESRELGEWTYGKHPDCDSEGWQCFFEPLSPCDTYSTSILASFPEKVHNRSAGIPRIALKAPEEFNRWGQGLEQQQHQKEEEEEEEGEEAYHGRLWWRSQLISRVLRPSPLLISMARQARLRMGLRSPYISVHVRMGDACTHAARKSPSGGTEGCVPVADYVEAALRMSQQYACTRVLLATDSQEAVEAFKAEQGLRVSTLDLERVTLFNSTWLIEERLRAKVVDASQVVQSAVLDLMLLSQGDYFVASLSGHMSRLALEYMIAEKGYLVPYISVEGPWCFELPVDYGTGFIDFC